MRGAMAVAVGRNPVASSEPLASTRRRKAALEAWRARTRSPKGYSHTTEHGAAFPFLCGFARQISP